MTEIDYTAASEGDVPDKKSYHQTLSEHWTRIKAVIVPNFLVICVLTSVLIALAYPVPGAYLSSIKSGGIYIISFSNICIVFLISGLTLKLNEMARLYQHWPAIVYGLVTINFLTTFLAFGLRVLPFETSAFPVGLTIFATVPTTLGVGITLTQASKGDQVLATLLTVLSNVLGIGSVPVLLSVYLSSSSSVQLDTLDLCLKLIYNVLIPSIFGILLQRFSSHVRDFVAKYKTELSMFSSFNLCVVVFMTLSASQSTLLQQNPAEIILVLVAAIIMHIVYLMYNYYICFHVFCFSFPQAVAVTILSSQKSSPVALSIIASISSDVKVTGLLAIPCIIGQIAQIVIGSFVAKHFLAQYERLPVAAPAGDRSSTQL